MQETITYCDVCGVKTESSYAVKIAWINVNDLERFDLCENCREKAVSIALGEVESKQNRKQLLSIVRMIFNRK